MRKKGWRDWCWKCGWRTNEWINWPVLFSRRGKCFYCRIDALDERYGPSQQAEMYKDITGEYKPTNRISRWRLMYEKG